MNNEIFNLKYFTILTLTFSGSAGLVYFIARKFFKKQLPPDDTNQEENKEITKTKERKENNINKQIAKASETSNSKKKETNKKLNSPKKPFKCSKFSLNSNSKSYKIDDDLDYHPEDGSSEDFYYNTIYKKRQSKEITKTTTSDVNSNREFKITYPVNFEIGNSIENININMLKDSNYNYTNIYLHNKHNFKANSCKIIKHKDSQLENIYEIINSKDHIGSQNKITNDNEEYGNKYFDYSSNQKARFPKRLSNLKSKKYDAKGLRIIEAKNKLCARDYKKRHNQSGIDNHNSHRYLIKPGEEKSKFSKFLSYNKQKPEYNNRHMDPSLQLAKKISCESNIFKSKSIGNTPRIICDDDNFYRIKDISYERQLDILPQDVDEYVIDEQLPIFSERVKKNIFNINVDDEYENNEFVTNKVFEGNLITPNPADKDSNKSNAFSANINQLLKADDDDIMRMSDKVIKMSIDNNSNNNNNNQETSLYFNADEKLKKNMEIKFKKDGKSFCSKVLSNIIRQKTIANQININNFDKDLELSNSNADCNNSSYRINRQKHNIEQKDLKDIKIVLEAKEQDNSPVNINNRSKECLKQEEISIQETQPVYTLARHEEYSLAQHSSKVYNESSDMTLTENPTTNKNNNHKTNQNRTNTVIELNKISNPSSENSILSSSEKDHYKTNKFALEPKLHKYSNSNDTTLNIFNNFKDLKELNFTNNDLLMSSNLFCANNKTNFMNSFDIYNEDENFSFEVANMFEDADSHLNKDIGSNLINFNSHKANILFDKKHDVSAIAYEGIDAHDRCQIISNKNKENFFLNENNFINNYNNNLNDFNNNLNSRKIKVIECNTELEAYLKAIIEKFDFSCDGLNLNNKHRNNFCSTVKVKKFELANNYQSNCHHGKYDSCIPNSAQLSKKVMHMEIIDPAQFNLILKFLNTEINQKATDLNDHYKSIRRKFFDENIEKQTEYISIVKELILKRISSFNNINRELCFGINISKKVFFESFVFYFALAKFLFDNSINNSATTPINSDYLKDNFDNVKKFLYKEYNLEGFFNSKAYEKYYSLFSYNNIFNHFVTSTTNTQVAQDIYNNILRLNHVGIKEVMAPKILNYDRLMKIVNYQNKKIKDLMLKFPHLSITILEIFLSDLTYAEYGIDNEAIIAAYKKIKKKVSDCDKVATLNSKMKNIKYYNVIFIE